MNSEYINLNKQLAEVKFSHDKKTPDQTDRSNRSPD
jgi:hypothetical protein